MYPSCVYRHSINAIHVSAGIRSHEAERVRFSWSSSIGSQETVQHQHCVSLWNNVEVYFASGVNFLLTGTYYNVYICSTWQTQIPRLVSSKNIKRDRDTYFCFVSPPLVNYETSKTQFKFASLATRY